MMPSTRSSLQTKYIGAPIPRLWCPPLTHFSDRRTIDKARFVAHLEQLAPYARGWLVPGSTGEGWQMDDDEVRQVLAIVLEVAQRTGVRVLIGALRRTAKAAGACIDDTVKWLCQRESTSDPEQALLKSHVCGFTVCPPHGATCSAEDIESSLRMLLQRGLPMAIYQLPQVTMNEVPGNIAARLAAEYPNFLLFKDTSGSDRVALAETDLGGVFSLRGAEGNYARWLRGTVGVYDGFLLSTANCFARQYVEMIAAVEMGDLASATSIIAPAEQVVKDSFSAVSTYQVGNPFTNANKAIDHWMAHGKEALSVPTPLLIDGDRLPVAIVEQVGASLARHDLLPTTGYYR